MKRLKLFSAAPLSAIALAALSSAAVAAPPSGPHVAPAITQLGKSLGRESASTPLTLTAWLTMHNRAGLDSRVDALYAAGSPTYHQWLTAADLKAYAPTDAELAAVKAELKAHNLAVESVDPLNLSVRFTGKTADVEAAFGTEINRVMVGSKLTRTAVNQPQMRGAAAGLIEHLAGLNTLPPRVNLTFPTNPRTKQKVPGIPVSQASTNGLYFPTQCLYAPATVNLKGLSSADDTTPLSASYSGLIYGAVPSGSSADDGTSCGYSPSQVQSFYGLNTAFGLGYTGTGETIVLIDAYQEPTAQPDLTTFSKIYGLPAINSSNFQIYTPYGANELGSTYGVDEETDLDIEWAHATAPGANLALVLGFSEDEEDIQSAILYAVTSKLGNVISVSYGYPEYYFGQLASTIYSEIAELGAAQGIAVNVSSGDAGDDTLYGGPKTVEAPADSPYATAVGGTSAVLTSPGGPVYQTGWGTNLNSLSSVDAQGNEVISDPPQGFFYGGSGGGASSYFAKPAYQSALPGSSRLMPDVSALADPYTGAEFIYTDPTSGKQMVGVVGGTSLAAPIFSGIWTIADEYFGTPLGQAAPLVAATVGSFITDVLPIDGPYKPSGTVTGGGVSTTFSADQLSQPLFAATQYTGALWNAGGGYYYNVTFGTDSSLTITPGWDNVTGYGTPNIGAALLDLGAKPKQ